MRPDEAVVLDSRALAYLKLGNLPAAIADYEAALAREPNLASALYGRGYAKSKAGDEMGGQADIAAAKALKADIVEEFERYGVK